MEPRLLRTRFQNGLETQKYRNESEDPTGEREGRELAILLALYQIVVSGIIYSHANEY